MKASCFMVLALVLSGCTSQAWYEGFKERERHECHKLRSPSDINACLEQVNSMSFEEYKRERNDNL